MAKCPVCNGTKQSLPACPECKGTGEKGGKQCRLCGGKRTAGLPVMGTKQGDVEVISGTFGPCFHCKGTGQV